MHIKQELERTTSGMRFIKHRITKDNSVMGQSFHAGSRIFILMIIFIGVLLSGCGSNDYILEISDDYVIARTDPEHRWFSQRCPNSDNCYTYIEDYSVTEYFVVNDLIGMRGFIDDVFDLSKDHGSSLDQPKVDVFYIVDMRSGIIYGPYQSREHFLNKCIEIGIDITQSINWLDPEKVWHQKQGMG